MSEVDVTTDDGGPFDLGDVNSLRLDEILPHPGGLYTRAPFHRGDDPGDLCADLVADWDPDPGAD
ncbi:MULTISPECIES: hypothetical protein [Streptomycetaceae]|uniref:hypothetical protein n=1 Tax=Streptomycetaceae TaxID=2062 RepID=UPI0003707785|nr:MULTISPECIES: hypothetical protein [Streptomycetaceae]MYX37984.1 hypothetical protein [Streptomyces sp. SID8377]